MHNQRQLLQRFKTTGIRSSDHPSGTCNSRVRKEEVDKHVSRVMRSTRRRHGQEKLRKHLQRAAVARLARRERQRWHRALRLSWSPLSESTTKRTSSSHHATSRRPLLTLALTILSPQHGWRGYGLTRASRVTGTRGWSGRQTPFSWLKFRLLYDTKAYTGV